MKKMMVMAMIIACGFMVSCKQENAARGDNKPAAENTGVNAWALVQQLAAYGFENEDAAALVEAANILLDIDVTEAEFEVAQASEAAEDEQSKEEKPAVTVDELLNKALEFGAEQAQIDAVKARQAQIAEMDPSARGARGGAKVVTDIVYSHSNCEYYCDFYGGQAAAVVVSGDGDTDLDLYIYDEGRHLITYDDDYTDQCVCTFTPSWTGRFYMKVVNRGSVYNRFTLATN